MIEKKILFYGNCQLHALFKTIENSCANTQLITCWLTDMTKEEFTHSIKDAKIIITQPIKEDYRDKDYMGTNYVINNCAMDAIVIIFPSLHFNFYYFDCNYKFYNNEMLRVPSDYHYNGIINCLKENKDMDYFINNVYTNCNYKTKEELLDIAHQSINELRQREKAMQEYKKKSNIYIIPAAEFIEQNFQHELLFWTVNHPTKYVFQYLAFEILKLLDLPLNKINKSIDILSTNEKCLLYKCLENAVYFNVNNFKPRLNQLEIHDPFEIISAYYTVYKDKDPNLFH